MIPLRIRAYVSGQISLPNGPLALDSLLAARVALRDGLPPPSCAANCQPIQIPVAMEPDGRFYLCSFSVGELTEYDVRWVNRRPPIGELQKLGPDKGRINLQGGPDKSYRLPLEVGFLADGYLEWFAHGDGGAIAGLLSGVHYLGKKRSVGLGRVDRWEVEECDEWDGFPVLRDGLPLRALPLDWPGLSGEAPQAYRTLTYPYWDHTKEAICACPG